MHRLVPTAFRAPRYAHHQVHSFPDRGREARCFADLSGMPGPELPIGRSGSYAAICHARSCSRSPLHAAESTGTSTCSKLRSQVRPEGTSSDIVWMGGDAHDFVACERCMPIKALLPWSKYLSLANTCSLRACGYMPTGSDKAYGKQRLFWHAIRDTERPDAS
jgi:hypothetical protein